MQKSVCAETSALPRADEPKDYPTVTRQVSTGQASLYDPSTNAWMSGGALTAPLSAHAVTFLHTGQVLVTGGFTSGAEVTTAQRYTR